MLEQIVYIQGNVKENENIMAYGRNFLVLIYLNCTYYDKNKHFVMIENKQLTEFGIQKVTLITCLHGRTKIFTVFKVVTVIYCF